MLLLVVAIAACPSKTSKTSESTSQTSGSTEPAAWLVFDVAEAGTGNGLSSTVWPEGMPDDFETLVEGAPGVEQQFVGIGRREDGWALPFKPGASVALMIWSPGHELARVEVKVKKGENPVRLELRRAEVEDERVPERIRLEVLQALPSEGPKSGS